MLFCYPLTRYQKEYFENVDFETPPLKKSQCIITTFLIRKHTAAIDPLPQCTMCTLVKMITIPEDP